jgi:DNA-binding MarR family transcriptional regulator
MNRTASRKRTKKGAQSTDAAINYGPLTGLIGYHLRRAQAVVFDDFMRGMADSRITPGQFGVLALIEANPGISQSALARALGTERSTMVAVLDQLEARGLAERRIAEHDRRSHALELTAKGGTLLSTLKPKIRRHEQRIAGDLDRAEKEHLIELLRRIGQTP